MSDNTDDILDRGQFELAIVIERGLSLNLDFGSIAHLI